MSSNIKDYNDIKSEASKPERERQKIIKTNRGNIRKPRRYHMDDDTTEKMLKEFKKTSVFQNPYRNGGLYHAFVQALIDLGIDEKHSFVDVKNEMEKILSSQKNLWDIFNNRKPRNLLSGKDINGRIIENAAILQRLTGLHPFRRKVRQLNSVINIYKDVDGLPKFELYTKFKDYKSVEPINEMRKQKRKTT